MAHFTRLYVLGIHVAKCRVASWFQVKDRNSRCLYGCSVSKYHVISLWHKTSIYSKVWRNLKSKKKWRETCVISLLGRKKSVSDNDGTVIQLNGVRNFCGGTALQAERWRVRILSVSLEIFIDIILPVALWPWGRLSPWQKWVPGLSPGGKGGRCVGLTTLPP